MKDRYGRKKWNDAETLYLIVGLKVLGGAAKWNMILNFFPTLLHKFKNKSESLRIRWNIINLKKNETKYKRNFELADKVIFLLVKNVY